MSSARSMIALTVIGACLFAAGAVLGASRVAGSATVQLRTSEAAGPAMEVSDGPLAFRVIAWRCGLLAVAGDHADWLPDGQYCRLRVRVENRERAPTNFNAADQQLVDSHGQVHAADMNSTQIADQPTSIEVKGGAAYEFDLWFDVPKDADIVSAVFRDSTDDRGATLELLAGSPE